jgi:molybdate transport system substrate-binding protein
LIRLVRCMLLALSLLLAGPAAAQGKAPLVLAAASMQEALTAAADRWVAKGHARPVISFAASSALARQIEAGAPADLFISADEQWMDYVAAKARIVPASRADLLGNRLVLIAPAGRAAPVALDRRTPIARLLGANGRLAMADPETVPAGKYGRAALMSLGHWPTVARRIARAENVRAALALVERGEAPLGIVYATDARASTKVRILGAFPSGSHQPIRYPVARLTAATSKDAEPFRRFLLSGEARAIFLRFGFTAP